MAWTRRQFLAIAAAAGAAGCGRARQTVRVSSPVPEAYDACRDPARKSLRLLTWNVFMMPQWIRESPRNEPRAAAIAAALLEEDFDILCLEKVFDAGAQRALERALQAGYPHRYGPANGGGGVKLNSGVWVLSRQPLTDFCEMEFDDCSGIECLSRKGAVLLSGRCGPVPFRLVVTHLQGEEGARFTPKNERVRHRQMLAIRDELLAPSREPGVPVLVCGDLGTPRFTEDGAGETACYREMLATLDAENGAPARITLDESPGGSELVSGGSGRKNELDYVLLQPNGARVTVDRTRRIFRRGGWDDRAPQRTDLSYRYAVEATVSFDG